MNASKWAIRSLVAAASALAISSAHAAPITWTDWTSINSTTAVGTIGGIGVTVTGALAIGGNRSQTSCGINYWTQPNAANPAYTDGVVSNLPTACEQVALATATTVTVTFASAISDLVMALVSVGQTTVPITYSFSQSFTLDSEGVGYWGGGQPGAYASINNTSFTGREFHGVLRFDNPVTQLTFRVDPNENWHAFTFGSVPEPGSLALVGAALLGAGAVSRRRKAA